MVLGPDGPVVDWSSRLLAALSDPDESVRLEALRLYGRHSLGNGLGNGQCFPAIAAANTDLSAPVVLAALDLLTIPCSDADLQRVTLLHLWQSGLAAISPEGATRNVLVSGWHRAAHAMVALASADPVHVRSSLPEVARHPSPFFRAWVARAAAVLEDEAVLLTLAADVDANVRTAAVRGLGQVVGAAADSVYRAQLASDDPQLVMTAARLLRESPQPVAAAEAMAAAFLRSSTTRKETARDVRLALLDVIDELGALAVIDLRPFLTDYDPDVAARAAELTSLGEPDPQPLENVPTPDGAELRALSRSSVVLEMAGGGEIEIRLRPDWAATNAARFARLAREGYYDGLTFHRVVPNFVIQGGSPGANEYAGADRYTRDETGLPAHWEGTVGVSTRGRDTGDGQIFINLVDNVRLDHDYTIFGEVVRGMDVAREVLEGDVIQRARVVERDS
jgi:cyclophilin family peptidyl-prolyl cis-trans isomerase/HEAT repeat protein